MDDWRYEPGFAPDADRLLDALQAEIEWTSMMRSRRTASMGVPYNYAGMVYPVAEWHPAVAALRPAIAARCGFSPTNCLLNWYPTGDHGLGWHADDVDILAPGTGIAIVSLGATRALHLRARGPDGFAYARVVLESGSLLLMSAAMQSEWQHSLPRVESATPRISLTFREIVRVTAGASRGTRQFGGPEATTMPD